MRNLPLLDYNRWYTVPQVAAYRDESPSRTYQKIHEGKIRAIEDEDRIYVQGKEIVESRARNGVPVGTGPVTERAMKRAASRRKPAE